MKTEYLKLVKEDEEFDFEVSSMITDLSYEDFNELRSMLVTAIGTMEIMWRNKPEGKEEPTLDYITDVIFPKYNIKGKLITNKIVDVEDITIGNYNYDCYDKPISESRLTYIGIDPAITFSKTSSASIRIYPNASHAEIEKLIYKVFRDKKFRRKWFKEAPFMWCGSYITIGTDENKE